jgi:hypothetical protein
VIPVVVEAGARRVFAAAVDWPGWCRSGKGEQEALEALAAEAPRYAAVAARAGLTLPDPVAFEVVERVGGSITTDFGAPGTPAEVDARPAGAEAGGRMAALVAAAWATFDAIVAGAPQQLRKGPRGGGRDRDAIVAHELAALGMYARKLGVTARPASPADAAGVAALRQAVLDVIGRPSPGQPIGEKGWSPRYAARRVAWHTLDHAWEIENRAPA